MRQYFDYSTEVINAIEQRKPILALESTLITHGLPHPHNIEIAKEVHEIARAKDVTPATIAIMNGKIKIGLTDDELTALVENSDNVKASTRDIPYLLNKGLNGGTTIAATLYCADKASIRVFATGGMGGVHHGDSLDVSADLIELSRSKVALVCSGAKCILDLPRTLEFLETYSVPVIGYGTDNLPAFYTSTSPYKLRHRIDDIPSLVQLITTHWELGMPTGMLIANPIAAADEIPAQIIEPAIAEALKTAEQQKIQGKDITPFLLAELFKVTEGKTLDANLSLIKNNVRVGAELAAALN